MAAPVSIPTNRAQLFSLFPFVGEHLLFFFFYFFCLFAQTQECSELTSDCITQESLLDGLRGSYGVMGIQTGSIRYERTSHCTLKKYCALLKHYGLSKIVHTTVVSGIQCLNINFISCVIFTLPLSPVSLLPSKPVPLTSTI